ncbi:MAG: hypothetical protein M3381_11555 [Actinomycetota bacterium]|nr:hypothetical protein [Actinomycetota bacterium]
MVGRLRRGVLVGDDADRRNLVPVTDRRRGVCERDAGESDTGEGGSDGDDLPLPADLHDFFLSLCVDVLMSTA